MIGVRSILTSRTDTEMPSPRRARSRIALGASAARPWESCQCPVCASVGIDVLAFRGYNRYKHRGAHNMLMLYRSIEGVSYPGK